jgi:pyrimidine operon attenuation protein / uracil phosphoribosyltransferase
MNQKTLILDPQGIHARIRRMAFEVYEQNFDQSELILLGIGERGSYLASCLAAQLQQISTISCTQLRVEVVRNGSGMMNLILSEDASLFQGKTILIVDDVLYSGRTQLSVVAQLLTVHPHKIQTLCLIDRGHRMMPISPDFVGLELATTLQQHVSFELAEAAPFAYLI